MKKLFKKVFYLMKSGHIRDYKILDKENDTLENLAINLEAMENQKDSIDTSDQKEKSYWRFAQSEKGKSYEDFYIEFKEGKITSDKNGLSFVSNKNIAKCYMYGDLLIKLNFDIKDKKFKKIAKSNYIQTRSAMEEYVTTNLLPQKIYSLEEFETIKLLFDMTVDMYELNGLLEGPNYNKQSFQKYLIKYGFFESAELVEKLERKYFDFYHQNKNNQEFIALKKEILDFIDSEIRKKDI